MTDHEHVGSSETDLPQTVDINQLRRKLGMHVSENVQPPLEPAPEVTRGQAPDLNNLTPRQDVKED